MLIGILLDNVNSSSPFLPPPPLEFNRKPQLDLSLTVSAFLCLIFFILMFLTVAQLMHSGTEDVSGHVGALHVPTTYSVV